MSINAKSLKAQSLVPLRLFMNILAQEPACHKVIMEVSAFLYVIDSTLKVPSTALLKND